MAIAFQAMDHPKHNQTMLPTNIFFNSYLAVPWPLCATGEEAALFN